MTPFSSDQWVMLPLAFLLGLFVGMMFLSGGKWKRRYREEARLRAEETKRRETLEADLKHSEARQIAAKARDDRPTTR